MDNSPTIAFIPAKGNSVGIPGKNTKKLNNVPLIAYTLIPALESIRIDVVCVITNDEKVRRIAEQYASLYDGKRMMFIDEPEYMAQGWVQCDDVCHFGVKYLVHLWGPFGFEPGICLLLHPTTPFRYAGEIDNAISIYTDAGAKGTLVSGSWVDAFAWRKHGENIVPIGHDPMQRLGRQWSNERAQVFLENGGIYVFDGQEFMHRRVVRFPPYIPYNVDAERYIDLDTLEDWKAAEKYMEKSGWNVVKTVRPSDNEYSI